MGISFQRFLILLSALGAVSVASAQDISTTASHAIITDGVTGQVLYAKNADEPVPPASMSKLMTAAVVLDLIRQGEITPDTMFDVSAKAWRTGGSKMFVLVDTQIRVEDLLRGLMALSGNDAAVVLAENIGGTEAGFADIMNRKAHAWGLDESTFSNPNGLTDEGQRMSVADLAKLSKHIWDTYPDYRYLFSIEEMTWSDITQRNRNPLLATVDGADGMKTGHTEEAGYGLVGSATRDGVRRIVVVTGLDSERDRSREAQRLMRIAFDDFLTETFFERGDLVSEAEVFGGKAQTVPLAIDVPVRFTRHRSVLRDVEATVVYDGPVPAPIRAGEQIAVMRFAMPGEELREYPLYASQAVPSKGVIAKMGLGLKILFTPPAEATE